MADVRIGISGWTYPGWRGDFYPKGLPQRRELEHAAKQLSTIEVNGTFYSLQKPSSYRSWAAQTPDDFVFSIKGSRFVTHMKRLRGVEVALANYFASGPLALGPKLGPVLWQLPPTMAYDAELVAGFLGALPRSTGHAARLAGGHDERVAEPCLDSGEDRPLRHAVEVRHPSMATEPALDLFRRLDVAVVVADSAQRFPRVEQVTGSFVYVRLHGDQELYASGYGAGALQEWAARMRSWRAKGLDVFAYFDNDIKGHAPHDALELAAMVRPGRTARA